MVSATPLQAVQNAVSYIRPCWGVITLTFGVRTTPPQSVQHTVRHGGRQRGSDHSYGCAFTPLLVRRSVRPDLLSVRSLSPGLKTLIAVVINPFLWDLKGGKYRKKMELCGVYDSIGCTKQPGRAAERPGCRVCTGDIISRKMISGTGASSMVLVGLLRAPTTYS